jgi:predicted amidohydrolase
MRAALFQGPAQPGSKEDMLRTLARAAGQASVAGAALLVLPELFLTGYNIGAAALNALAEKVDGPSAARAGEIARACGLAVLYGYPERGADGKLYNSALLLGPDGERLANYRKTHLFGADERATYTPGDEPFVLADVGGMRVGILICYDVEFPELTRGLALRGAELVAVPTAQMKPYEFVPEAMLRTRAFENQIFMMYANRCGSEPPLDYVGASCIVAPDGSDLARAGLEEALLVADLDMAAMAESRAGNTYLRDRRPELYQESKNVLF